MNQYIEIKNAHIHNLKGIDVKIPKNKLTVITGVSGSGKSSLAFDTLYEEGKRRYLMFSNSGFMVEGESAFDQMTGLSPTVAVEQRIIRQSNPRSTVGTKTKISNMLAVLFATYGEREKEYEGGNPLTMEMFQKNSAKGMCVKCLGKGIIKKIDEEKLFGDGSQKIEDVCLGVGKRGTTKKMLESFYKYYKVTGDTPLNNLTSEALYVLKYGDYGKSSFIGFMPWITEVTNGAFAATGRLEQMLTEEGYMEKGKCPKCQGMGLGEEAIHTTIGGKTISEMEQMYIKDLYEFLSKLSTKNRLIQEILTKLECMIDVGLYHLALSRSLPTLSGGEIQRLFLASYIIADMDAIIFIFDEPTIGLHEIEKAKLIDIIKKLVGKGNTVVAVEHDEGFIRQADYMIDLGPDAGILGGAKIYEGDFNTFLSCDDSRTAPYLSGKRPFMHKEDYRGFNENKLLTLKNASLHNLKNITVDIPLGVMVGVVGISGSGKSSLISETLVPKLKASLKSKCVMEDELEEAIELGEVELLGVSQIKKCYVIDQKPIGRTKTSCLATYSGVMDRIRQLFAKASDLPPGFFSVNAEGGCPICKGEGEVHYHVGYGNFIHVKCEACGGIGFIPESAEVTLEGKNIKDVLEMSVDEAITFFSDKDELITNMLETLKRVGMGYIKLGQKTPTISGGESQRIKLAKELAKGQAAKDSLYILDEPTTGLSFYDSEKLMVLLQELVDKGNTVIIIEHDSHVLSSCDYLIEMGTGGGKDGGEVIATGTPRELKENPHSIIGRYLC